MQEFLKVSEADIDLITYALRRLKGGSGFTTLREAAGDLITRIENRNAGDSLTQYVERHGFRMSNRVQDQGDKFFFCVTTDGYGEKTRKRFVKFVIDMKQKYGELVDVRYKEMFEIMVWTTVHPDKLFLK